MNTFKFLSLENVTNAIDKNLTNNLVSEHFAALAIIAECKLQNIDYKKDTTSIEDLSLLIKDNCLNYFDEIETQIYTYNDAKRLNINNNMMQHKIF
jgi:hypothetical protein